MDELDTLLCPAHGDHVRQGEASIVAFDDGRLLLAWSDFYGGRWQDEAAAQICGKWSDDKGCSWSEPFVLQENTGGLNVMSASLLRLPSGRVLLAFGRKETEGTLLHSMVKHSDDEGRSWSEPRAITCGDAYWCHTNDRLVRLESGRLLWPVAEEKQVGCHCWISDDDGLSWRQGSGAVRPAGGLVYQEPTVVELPAGPVAMFLRGNAGNIHIALSEDAGDSWQLWKSHAPDMCGHPDAGPNAAQSPCMVKRIPGSDDLLLVWNNNRVRTPLTSAISSDNAASWHHIRNLEAMDGWPPRLTHAYPSVTFLGDNVHLTYWETHTTDDNGGRVFHLRYRRLPITWFYKPRPK
jgi:sialidase-1